MKNTPKNIAIENFSPLRDTPLGSGQRRNERFDREYSGARYFCLR